MSIVLVGVNHRSAPLEVRERLTFPASDLAEALQRFTGIPSIAEALILSTCNRTELLVHANGRGTADRSEAMKQFLASERNFPASDLDRYCYRMTDRDAVHHFFRVAASLDSLVMGEAQILGQVKEAYQAAVKAGSIGVVLDPLLRRALGVAKKVRTQTGIARHPHSVSSAAVSLARTIFEDLKGRRVLLIGAGKMGELAARALLERGADSVMITNRSYPRALELAQSFGGQAEPFERLLETLERVDIVISSTAAPEPILRYEDVAKLIRSRKNRPIFFIDIAVPRDIEARVNTIDNVYLYDLDDLTDAVSEGRTEREAEATLAEAIVRREVEAFETWVRHQDLSPLIVATRERLEQIRSLELERHRSRLASLTEEQRRAVEELTGGLLSKILHHPIQALKRTVRHPDGPDRALFFKEVFGLEEDEKADDRMQEDQGGGGLEKDDSSHHS
jgi:glutamyl-tRNA reductase